MSATFYTPLTPPPAPQNAKGPEDLTGSHEKMFQKALAHFSSADYKLPGVENGELTEAEKFWLSHECILRYLRATKWTVDTSISRLEVTLKWRREYGLYDLVSAEHVEPEATTGKEVLFGYDVQRRPALYMIPSRQNTSESPRQVQFAVWMLERTIDLMGPGVESLALLINFADRAKNPSLSTARTVLNILQDHYPERLGLALIINVPFLVNAFFKLIMPFVDPITRAKVKFNPEVIKDGLIAPDNIMKQWWGGDCEFSYEHEKYWPALVKMCEKKRAGELERWKTLGGRVGLKEWDFKRENAPVDEVEKVEKDIPIEVPTEAVEVVVA